MSLTPIPLRRRRLPQLLGIGFSALGLAGLVQLQSVWAQDETELLDADEELDLDAEEDEEDEEVEQVEQDEQDEQDEPVALASVPSAAPSTPKPVLIAEASAALPSGLETKTTTAAAVTVASETAEATEASAAIVPDVPVLVAVPDLSGLSVRKARRILKDAGLKIAVRDGYGYRVPREEWNAYKVRGQKLDAGTEVELGSRVRVKARMKRRYAMGY